MNVPIEPIPMEPIKGIAIFCDFDGTLVNIAPTPTQVYLSPTAQTTISTLQDRCNSAFAVISGRPLAEIKQFLTLVPFNGAGCHGAEIEYAGQLQELGNTSQSFVEVKQNLKDFAEQRQLIWEDKGHSFAIHFRLTPELEQTVDEFIDKTVAQCPDLKKLHGKLVREVKPGNFDKGSAIAQLLQMPTFANKKPYYFGDDTTDEDAFAYINRIGGVSVKIGSGVTQAKHRLESPEQVIQFFETLIQEP